MDERAESKTKSWKDFPDKARVWVYQAARELSQFESEELLSLGLSFAQDWASHGASLNATFEVLHQRFAIFFVDEATAQASGCSIDTSVQFMQRMETQFDTSFLNRMILCYREGGGVKQCVLHDIPRLVEEGALSSETLVFDNLVLSKGDFLNRWEVRMDSTWTQRYLS